MHDMTAPQLEKGHSSRESVFMNIAEPTVLPNFLSILDAWFEVIACLPHMHVMVSRPASAAASETRTVPGYFNRWSALILGSDGLCAVS
jgi:hypothetical protein